MAHVHFPQSKCNKGFTLIELMVALLLGGILIAGMLQIFFGAKKTYRLQENMAHLQENGRLAMAFITQDVRMAGYWGCGAKPPSDQGIRNNKLFFYNVKTAIEGFEAISTQAWAPSLDATFDRQAPDSVLGGSDILTIRSAQPGFPVITQESTLAPLTLDASVAQLTEAGIINDKNEVSKSLLLMASKCTSAEIFQATGIVGASIEHHVTLDQLPDLSNESTGRYTDVMPGNTSNSLTDIYQGYKLHVVNTVSYYVAINRSGNKLLYQRTGSAAGQELVEGVEQMQVLYGVDADRIKDGTPNYYVSANNVNNWDNVVSVRIYLLVATTDDYLAEKPLAYPYPFNSGIRSATASDLKMRRVFTSTIAIRNRLKIE